MPLQVPDERWQCPGVTRRSFLADTGMGFTGLALGAMLARESSVNAAGLDASTAARPLVPRAKAVIWIFLCGGVSHVESFDPKPELNRFAGKSIDSTPYKEVLNPEKLKDVVSPNPVHGGRKFLMGLNAGFKKYGQSGLEVGDWWQNVGSCADDIAVVRSLWTSDNDHGAQLQFHTGRHVREGAHPTIGSWVAYGLGTLNENLPEYVVLGEPTGDCCGGSWTHGAAYLGPEHAGVRLNPDGKEPLPFVAPGAGMSHEEQVAEFSLMGRLNRLAGIDYPDDPALRARIKAYELAYGMQTAVPDTLRLEEERPATQSLYGLDRDATRSFGRLCLSARRMVERGVRFVQIFHGGGGGGAWDAHAGIMANHSQLSSQVDLPIAGLPKDPAAGCLTRPSSSGAPSSAVRRVRRPTAAITTRRASAPGWPAAGSRGVSCTVRPTKSASTPSKIDTMSPTSTPPFCISLVSTLTSSKSPVESGLKSTTVSRSGPSSLEGGHVHGATDDFGFQAVENKVHVHVHDPHATLLYLMSFDHEQFTYRYAGRDFRLTDVHGTVVKDIIA